MVQWVESRKAPARLPPTPSLASKISALNGVGEMVTSGLRIKNSLKKNFMLFLRDMAGLGDLFASLQSDFAENPPQH